VLFKGTVVNFVEVGFSFAQSTYLSCPVTNFTLKVSLSIQTYEPCYSKLVLRGFCEAVRIYKLKKSRLRSRNTSRICAFIGSKLVKGGMNIIRAVGRGHPAVGAKLVPV
jgi:hypothetical protein